MLTLKKMRPRTREIDRTISVLVKSYYATTWPRLADYILNNYVYIYHIIILTMAVCRNTRIYIANRRL